MNTELSKDELARLQSVYPDCDIELEFYCNFYRVYVNEKTISKAIEREDAIKEAMTT
jgi:hypothetical protein